MLASTTRCFDPQKLMHAYACLCPFCFAFAFVFTILHIHHAVIVLHGIWTAIVPELPHARLLLQTNATPSKTGLQARSS